MSCGITYDEKGNILKVENELGQPSKLYQDALKATNSENDAKRIFLTAKTPMFQEAFPKYQILGEIGAQNLDISEEVTFRMDNLLIAKDMEKAGKSPKEIRLATGWERGVSEFNGMSEDDIITTLLQRGEITETEC